MVQKYPFSSREKRLSGKDLIQPSLTQPGVVAARWAECLHRGWPSPSAEVFLDPPKVSRQRQQWKITTSQCTYEYCGSLSLCQGVGSVWSAQKSLEEVYVFLFSSLVFFLSWQEPLWSYLGNPPRPSMLKEKKSAMKKEVPWILQVLTTKQQACKAVQSPFWKLAF